MASNIYRTLLPAQWFNMSHSITQLIRISCLLGHKAISINHLESHCPVSSNWEPNSDSFYTFATPIYKPFISTNQCSLWTAWNMECSRTKQASTCLILQLQIKPCLHWADDGLLCSWCDLTNCVQCIFSYGWQILSSSTFHHKKTKKQPNKKKNQTKPKPQQFNERDNNALYSFKVHNLGQQDHYLILWKK